jgi:flagellar protein FlgJ
MFRPDFAPRATAAAAPTPPLQPVMARGNGFAALIGEVRADTDHFIANGSPSTAWASLTVEAQAMRARLQGTGAVAGSRADSESQQAFLASIALSARETGQRLGVAPELVAAHAALESGWGQRPLRQANGEDTNNLFGIKAGARWSGAVTTALTTEHEAEGAVKKSERFRSYPDQASAFRDYAQLLLDNPRYRAALNTGSDARAFAHGLARGGYATDPAYADKLERVARSLQAGD